MNHSSVTATKVLLLRNMVTESDLDNDEEFAEILDDVRSECEKFGAVTQVFCNPFGVLLEGRRGD